MTKKLKSERNEIKQGNIQITTELVTQQTRKVPSWKCPGPDGVQGYWLKKFPALHERIATQMSDIINNKMDIPKWMIQQNQGKQDEGELTQEYLRKTKLMKSTFNSRNKIIAINT